MLYFSNIYIFSIKSFWCWCSRIYKSFNNCCLCLFYPIYLINCFIFVSQFFSLRSFVCFSSIKVDLLFSNLSLTPILFPPSLHSHVQVSSPLRHASNVFSSPKYSFILLVRVLPLIYFILYLKWLRQYYVCYSILLWIVLKNRIYKSWHPQRISFNTLKNGFSTKVFKEKECVFSLDNGILSWDTQYLLSNTRTPVLC